MLLTAGFHETFSAGRQLTAQEQSSQVISCSTPTELETGEQPAIRWAGPARSKHKESLIFWEPCKSGGSGNRDNRRGGTCCWKTQNGASKLDGWGGERNTQQETGGKRRAGDLTLQGLMWYNVPVLLAEEQGMPQCMVWDLQIYS